MSDYPKMMVHPSYEKSHIQPVKVDDARGKRVTDYKGTPDRYPPITVHNEQQEAIHRNLGYLEFGEKPKMTEYAEYPLMLQHPDYEPEVPDETVPFKTESGVTFTIVKGRPAKFPPVQVNTPHEESALSENGYRRPGLADPKAAESAKAVPHNPAHAHREWPKMVNGQTVADPKAPVSDFQKYPMMVGDVVVNSESEEAAERKRQGLSAPVPAVVPRDGRDAQIEALQQQIAALTALVQGNKKNKGGRPKGSKNKPKAQPQPEAAD